MKRELSKTIFIWITTSFMLVFCLLPFFWMIVVSFGKNPDFLLPKVAYLFTLENYKSICTVKSVHFIDYLKNSLIISSIVATISVLIASLSAYAISRLKFPGRVLIPITIIALSMFPQISIVGYLFKLMSNLGWINTYNSLIFPYIAWAMPLALWIVLSYFMQIPEELDEAALMDGATRIQILFRVIFPIALPGLFSTLLLIFIFSFNEFLFALMLTTDWRARTIPIGIALFQGLHGEIPWGEIMAASVIAVVPLVLLTLIFQRNIIEGLTRGALK